MMLSHLLTTVGFAGEYLKSADIFELVETSNTLIVSLSATSHLLSN